MKHLEDFLKPTQKELFNLLRKKYRGGAFVRKDSYILIPGESPVMLLAHLDTVHEKPVKYICKSLNGNILMSPQGIGGDDRCGVYALVKIHEATPIKPWLLFTCDEEAGGIGADDFATDYGKGKLPKGLDALKLLIEIDRKGSNDAVYYDCDNSEFEAYITSKGFVTAYGSFSDISIIAPELGVAAVNLSSGYYNAHTLHEYINRKQINAVIQRVIEIIADAIKPDFPKYSYIKCAPRFTSFGESYSLWDGWGWFDAGKLPLSPKTKTMDETIPDNLPSYMAEMYNDLLEYYTQDELEWNRREYGDEIISQLYNAEFGPFYDTNDVPEVYEESAFEQMRKENQ